MATEMDARATATLLEEVDPVIRGAIRRKLRVTLRANDSREQNMDGLDLLGEVQLKLLTKLRQGEEQAGIAEFRGYAATVAYHCCADYLRAKYPQRTSLKNSLRRLMDKMDGYAVWTSADGELMCGFAGWAAGRSAAKGEKIRELQQNAGVLPAEALPRGSAESMGGKDWLKLLEAVFDFAEGPVAMDDLLTIVAPLTGVEDVPEYDDGGGGDDEDGGSAMDKVAAGGQDPYSARLTVERLKLFWGAVLQLLPWHRSAFLLNMRDGDLDALPYYGVASIEAIGESLELEEKQLTKLEQETGVGPATGSSKKKGERFAVCWRFLPLEDVIIAAVLGVTRPQVIGYRNKARERLARILKGAI
jgi:DNA-directed RNA polymerase specialized sigma24 family protein